jgi:dipeptidyl aminopeptidase/acylaminoacyl peptidase
MTEGHTPSWSENGEYIAFVRDGEIYTIRDIPEGSVQKITLGAMASRLSGIDWGSAGRIAYFQPGDSIISDRYLRIYSFYTNKVHNVQHESLGYAALPDWSRWGSMLVFSSWIEGICIYDTNPEIVRSIVYWGNPGKPCFYSTVDSTYVLFVENGYLYRINPDGTNRIIVYGDNFYPGSMDYSYTTGRLTFSCSGIWIMDFPPEEE